MITHSENWYFTAWQIANHFLLMCPLKNQVFWAGKHLKQVIIQFLFNRYHKTIHYYFPRETIMYTWQSLFVCPTSRGAVSHKQGLRNVIGPTLEEYDGLYTSKQSCQQPWHARNWVQKASKPKRLRTLSNMHSEIYHYHAHAHVAKVGPIAFRDLSIHYY